MKNIIITGGGKGIGFELVKQLAESNNKVLAISRNTKKLEELNNKNIFILTIDLSESESFDKIVDYISKNWTHVDILINNAAKFINKPFIQTNIFDFIDIYKINVFAVAELTRRLLPLLAKNSHVVNISSMGGVQGSLKFSGLSAYSSSKGAIITLTELLAEEYKETSISFNTLALGAVQTEMLSEAFPNYKAKINAMEIANYIVDFALNGNKFYNGKTLQVSSSTP